MARRRNKPRSSAAVHQTVVASNLTAAQAYARWDAMAASGSEMIGAADAYKQSAWVYGAINAIAWNLANWPQRLWRASNDEVVESGPLWELIERPNPYGQQNTSTSFRFAWMTELLLNGSVCKCFPVMAGFEPRQMVVMPRWRFVVEDAIDPAGLLYPVRFRLVNRAGGRFYSCGDDLAHDALYNPYHDWEGLSPLEAALIGINNDVDSGEFAHRYFKNDSSTGLVFTSDHPGFRQTQAEEAARRWQEKYSGVQRAFGAKFVGFGLKPHQVGSPFDEAAHRTLKSLTKEEIVTGIYKIPLAIFGAEQASAGVQIGDHDEDSVQEAFLVNVIMPWAKRYDEEFERDITWRFAAAGTMGEVHARHDFDAHPLLEKRKLARAKIAVELIDRGIPLNQVIGWLKLNLEEVPWGNDWWVPNNMVPAAFVQSVGPDILKDSPSSPSNAGAKPAKPGVRDSRGKRAINNDDDRRAVLDAYIGDILRLADTADVKNAARSANGTGWAHRLADIMKECEV